MLTAAVDRLNLPVPMGAEEAEKITKKIQKDFNNLGATLMEARDRKAYKALGYASFEEYCNIEFKKPVSSVYRAIENHKILENLSKETSKRLEQEIEISIPESHLQALKKLDSVDLQLQALEKAQEIAKSQSVKPAKKHLELAVFEISGQRSEDFRGAIEALGFSKGTEVEVIKYKERGFVRKIDKVGKIHVQLHNGGADYRPCSAHELRILSEGEKPKIAVNELTAKTGLKVRIYSSKHSNQTGKIIKNLVGDGRAEIAIGENKSIISYSELEIIDETETAGKSSWTETISWYEHEHQWYYDADDGFITTSASSLRFTPYQTPKDNPGEWVKELPQEIVNVADKLLSSNKLESLLLARIISLSEEDKAEFITSLIKRAWQLNLPDECRKDIQELVGTPAKKAVGISFGKTLSELFSGRKTQTRRLWQDDHAKLFIRYWEEKTEIPALDKQRQYGGREIGKIRLTEKPYQQILSEMPHLDLDKEGGMCATVKDFIDTFFEGKDKLVWVLNFEFVPADSAEELATIKLDRDDLLMRVANSQTTYHRLHEKEVVPLLEKLDRYEKQLANTEQELRAAQVAISNNPYKKEIENLTAQMKEAEEAIEQMVNGLRAEAAQTPDLLLENTTPRREAAEAAQTPDLLLENTTPRREAAETAQTPEIISRIKREREKLTTDLERNESKLSEVNKKERNSLETKIFNLKGRLKDLDTFQNLKTNQRIRQRFFPDRIGTITGFVFTESGMPLVWVKWNDGLPVTETVGVLAEI